MEKEEKLGDALLKVALGYQVSEITEEYAEVDGTLKLTKRKKTKKDIPPDLKAVQMLLEGRENGDMAAMTDEELETERKRLLALLIDEEKQKKGEQVCVETKKTAAKPRKRVVRKTVKRSKET
ncbi:MAG: hypothetical protein J6A63_09085 [Clostridia bacterium]|nr:hypothetical protein [Clostridia bacterium]